MPALGEIVEHRSTPLGEVIIRYPRETDAPALLYFINSVSQERTYIHFQGEHLTMEQEIAWLSGRLAGIANGSEVQLVLEVDGTIAGTCGIARKMLSEQHTGVLGISIMSHVRGLGLGRALMQATMREAERNIAGLRLIVLDVFAPNERARRLYESEGFIEHGRLPGGVKYRDEYVDVIQMHRVIS